MHTIEQLKAHGLLYQIQYKSPWNQLRHILSCQGHFSIFMNL